jgi:hypothetical protein
VTTPPYGHDPYALPPGPGGNPGQQPPVYPASGGPPAYPAYGEPYGQQPGAFGSPAGYSQPTSVPPGGYGQPVSGLPQPYSPAGYTVGYPVTVPVNYGYDPITGQPYSDKSKVVAGLLQLLLGALLGLGGVGRTYAGNVGLGVTQIVLSVVGWGSFWCGFFLIVPWFITFGLWVWFVVDGIVMLAGRPVDGQGRLLRS